MRTGHAALPDWPLDPSFTYLNHGTVGVTPLAVLAAQRAIKDEIERGPAQFLLRRISREAGIAGALGKARPLLRSAADAVATLVGGSGDAIALVDNVTTAVSAVLRAVPLAPGDEIVVGEFAYGAVVIAATARARECGASVRLVPSPRSPFTPGAFVDAYAAALGPRTRLAIVDHVSAETAAVLPVAEIASRCHAAGVPVLVDGAHVPGAFALDVAALGVDWYAANLHKWAWTPRSAGLLWAAPGRAEGLHAPVWSWGHEAGFPAEFDWLGTRDPSPWLAAPAAIAHLDAVGRDAVFAHNAALCRRIARRLAERFGSEPLVPDSMLGTMATVALPESAGSTPEDAIRLRGALLEEDRIEVQLHAWRGRLWVRVSAQVYVEDDDVERLADRVLARTGAGSAPRS